MDKDYWLSKAAQHLEKAAGVMTGKITIEAETMRASEHHRALAETMIELATALESKPATALASNTSSLPDARPESAPQPRAQKRNAISDAQLEPSTASFDQLGGVDLPAYNHNGILEKDLFSEGKRKRTLAIAGKLFSEKGKALLERVLAEASVVIEQRVTSLERLRWKDGDAVMKHLESQAVAAGAWEQS
jgi:hypothetical protein